MSSREGDGLGLVARGPWIIQSGHWVPGAGALGWWQPPKVDGPELTVPTEVVRADDYREIVSREEFERALLDVALTPDSDSGARFEKAQRHIAALGGAIALRNP